jgi:hypothetical protein
VNPHVEQDVSKTSSTGLLWVSFNQDFGTWVGEGQCEVGGWGGGGRLNGPTPLTAPLRCMGLHVPQGWRGTLSSHCTLGVVPCCLFFPWVGWVGGSCTKLELGRLKVGTFFGVVVWWREKCPPVCPCRVVVRALRAPCPRCGLSFILACMWAVWPQAALRWARTQASASTTVSRSRRRSGEVSRAPYPGLCVPRPGPATNLRLARRVCVLGCVCGSHEP